MSDKIESLLNDIRKISKKYEEIIQEEGLNFNIFSITRTESDEVKTHSRIIAELLDPKGSHGQGSAFLKLFFDEIAELKSTENFDFNKAKIIVEEFIGITNKSYTRGGRIDIVIKDKNNVIVIENKIYASDQKGQLVRYKQHYPNAKIIYLTLFGEEPTEYSSKINNSIFINHEEIILVSYQKTIINWLENCLIQFELKPMISIIINHYLNTIKRLTNQTIFKKMEDHLVTQIIGNNNIKEVFQINNVLWALKEKLYEGLAIELDSYSNKEGLLFENHFIGDKNYGFYFTQNENKDKFDICVLFSTGNFNDLFYGIHFTDKIKKTEIKSYLKKFEKYDFELEDDIFIWNWFEDYRNWDDNGEIWEEVGKGKNGLVYKEIVNKIQEVIQILKS